MVFILCLFVILTSLPLICSQHLTPEELQISAADTALLVQPLTQPIAQLAQNPSVPQPSIYQTPSPALHPLAVLILALAILGFLSTIATLPFSLMSSDPRASSSSSSSRDPSKSSSSSSSSSARDPSKSSSSGSSGSSSSSGSGSSSSSPESKAPSSTPYISPNAWMSFFLFCCLVLIILQGPLGLTGPGGMGGVAATSLWPISNLGMPDVGWAARMPGCSGVAAAAVPWCQLVQPVVQPLVQTNQPVIQAVQPPPVIVNPQPATYYPQYGGQGSVAGVAGAGQYTWYSNSPQQPPVRVYSQQPAGRTVQYQRPGLQVQVDSTGQREHVQIQRGPRGGGVVTDPPPVDVAVPSVEPVVSFNPAATIGVSNLENAFYPLLIGAIALLVIFDYSS